MNDPKTYVEFLQNRRTKLELQEEIIRREGETTSELLELRRMNIIGGLRGLGYQIPRKRGEYQIVGFERPTPKSHPYSKAQIDEFAKIDTDDARMVSTKFGAMGYIPRGVWSRVLSEGAPWRDYITPYHEFSLGYLLSYEGANDILRGFNEGIVVAQKHRESPRFRILHPPRYLNPIYQPSSSLRSLSETYFNNLVTYLGYLSFRDIRLASVDPQEDYRSFGFVKYSTRRQAVYSVQKILSDLLPSLSKSTRNQVKKSLRELSPLAPRAAKGTQFIDDGTRVIDLWRQGPSGQKQRQLAIGRDYVGLRLVASIDSHVSLYSSLFYRGDYPVALELFDFIAPGWVGHLVGKALNYSSLPGGYGSTSLASMYLMCEKFDRLGIKWINGGSRDGGAKGLDHHKDVLSLGEQDRITYEWVKPGSSFLKEQSDD